MTYPASQGYCTRCGAQRAVSGRFCHSCGAPSSETPIPSSTAPQTPGHGQPKRKTNNLANASFWCSFAGLIIGLFLPLLLVPLGLVGVILGAVSHAQVQNSNGAELGRQTAIAAVVIGILDLVLVVVRFAT